MVLSFSRLSLFAGCPLRYRYLEVERLPEPDTRPDWRQAPRALGPSAVASRFDRALGVAVHAALARWQHAVDGGAAASYRRLLEAVTEAAERERLDPVRCAASLGRIEAGLRWYAEGPWPRRATLFLEHPTTHEVRGADGFRLLLTLRADRMARFRRGVAILDFKTVSPHVAELRADQWQLRTYALAAPGMLGLGGERIHLYLLDLQRAEEVEVASAAADLAGTTEELLGTGRRIAEGDFSVDDHPARPCWSCGFRLECPASLAPDPPPSER